VKDAQMPWMVDSFNARDLFLATLAMNFIALSGHSHACVVSFC
jgi:hypothetical protein